jgi:alpha-D-ribose 1-methylphosphonate 5-triphosphate synthase subunit PhnG
MSAGQPDTSPAIADITEVLATAEATELMETAEDLIAIFGDPTILTPPETGLVMMVIREPVCEERFHLGEVVVTRAEVTIAGFRGWAMRLGNDRIAALAAAICEAIGRSDLPQRALVDRLCERTASRQAAFLATEWQQLSATEVRFEELE